MNEGRTKRTINGTLWGVIEKIAAVFFPFLVRTILIKKMGAEYLGLNSLFTSILQVLNLAELGFGSAVIYSMYKPLAEGDNKLVCAIVTYLKKIYRVIGLIILLSGLLILPFVSFFIKGDVPNDVNIYIIYLVYLINTTLTYFLFAYKMSLLNALQRNDLISKIGFITSTSLNILQIGILLILKNYYIYIIMVPACTILNSLLTSFVVDKYYSSFLGKEEIDSDTKKQIKEKIFPLISTKIAGILLNSADTMVISAFLGLKSVAIYNNYYYVINALMGFIMVIYSSMQAGIGNALVKESMKKNIDNFNKFCFMNHWLITICSACLLCCYQPFIELWVGKEMMLPFGMVIMFVLYFYANMVQRIVVVYKDAAGIWKEDMVRCYLSSALNIIINISTVKFIGLYGVIGSTVIANLVGLPWMAYILYKIKFKESSKDFYITELIDMIISSIICAICFIVSVKIKTSYIGIVMKLIIAVVISNVLCFIVYKNNPQFSNSLNWIKDKFPKKGDVAHD